MKYIIPALVITAAAYANGLSAQPSLSQPKPAPQGQEYAGTSPSALKRTGLQTTERRDQVVHPNDKKEKVREALLPLLRGVFNTHWQQQEVLLTIDAGWRNDSLSIEYKYYRGTNVLALNEEMLVEKIYFTVRPEEIDELDTENDEFLFLYLRNSGKKQNIKQTATRPGKGERQELWTSSLGVPVRSENLQMIIQYLKDLRTTD